MRQLSHLASHKQQHNHQRYGKVIDRAYSCCRYTAAFAQLHNAARADADTVPDVWDPRQNLATSLARLSQVSQRHVVPY